MELVDKARGLYKEAKISIPGALGVGAAGYAGYRVLKHIGEKQRAGNPVQQEVVAHSIDKQEYHKAKALAAEKRWNNTEDINAYSDMMTHISHHNRYGGTHWD